MKPGRELDALIAEKVMGWIRIDLPNPIRDLTWIWDRKEGCLYWESQECPPYSTSIEAAWEIVEHMNAKELGFALDCDSTYAMAIFGAGQYLGDDLSGPSAVGTESVPHAICLAALQMVNL